MDAITFDESHPSPFDQIKQVDSDGSEYWLATELLTLLGYQTWKRIKDTVERAKISAKNSGLDQSHHLVDVVQMAQIGASQAFREVLKDYKLSRHACYLVAMNGDPRKSAIAAAQNYFAVKTREAELAPQTSELLAQLWEKLQQQNTVIEEQGKALAQLQSQIQNLLPPSTDFIPPGWDAEVWRSLPPQDKRHFRYIFRRRNFRPSGQGKDKSLALPAAITQQIQHKQRTEVRQLIGEVSPEEQKRLEAAKQEALKQLWSQGEQ
ncbi:MAG: DNA-damage-inducible protein [Mojavia pulchra JT2-VF2]|jgi:DNA-damage-inducible protein D|uniref:DNA-damage-inducible protein n=1 Tax=Mojavia pulchra JT2-VF2 TaxID=287848 RepID=A0A951Q2Z4_9NOST|nr:DNA-damage-inducible protein [Mojavia pulchra JT2-VF2]